jgi:hypothetical protein
MRFLKTLTLNRRAIYDDRAAIDTKNNFTLADTTVMTLPKSSSTISSPVEGQMRYNTSSHNVEVYQGSSATWRAIRYKEATTITQQSLGTGDGVEVNFGPLSPDPTLKTLADSTTFNPVSNPQNFIVLIENVFQVSTTNYTIVQNPSPTAHHPSAYTAGYYIQFSTPAPLNKPVTVLQGFDQ